MEIVTGDQAPLLEHTEAVRLLQEMAAVVRTIFAVDAGGQQEAAQQLHPGVRPEHHPVTAGAGGAPISGGTTPAPVVAPLPLPTPAGPPASLPVPGVALLQEIAFLDD